MPYSIKDLEQAGRAINAGYTRRHPFLSALFGFMVFSMALGLSTDLADQ